METQERNLSLDLIKIAAMIGVMTLHVTYFWGNYNDWLSCYAFAMAGISMPLFFMVSGYLMIGRDVTMKYIVKKTYKIVKFVFLICLLHWAIGCFGGDRSWKSLVYNFVFSFIQRGYLGFFWYFGSIIICYFLLPIFNAIIRNKLARDLTLLFFFILLSITWILNLTGGFEASICQTFRLWNWFFYFFLGGCLKTVYLQNMEILSRLGGVKYYKWFLLLLIGLVYMGVYLRVRPIVDYVGVEYMFGSTICVVMAILVFVCFLTTKVTPKKIISELSSLFLPVYALHTQVIREMKADVNFSELGMFAPLIEWTAVVFMTIAISWVLMKIPYFNKVFKL